MGTEDTGPCLITLSIILIVLGFFFWFYLIFIGGFFLILGICSSVQTTKKKTQPTPTYSKPSTPEQPKEEVLVKPSPETPLFCPNCGARTTSKICPECGSEID